MSSKLFASTKDSDPKRAEALLEQIKKDEASLLLTSFTPDQAVELGMDIRKRFLEVQQVAPTLNGEDAHQERYGHTVYQNLPVKPDGVGIVIHIETFTGHTLFTATAGAPVIKPMHWKWIRGKINMAREMHASSFRVGRDLIQRDRDPADMGYPFPEYAPFGGAFPIWIQGVTVAPVAVIAVSGLSQDQDHQLIVDTLRAHIARNTQK